MSVVSSTNPAQGWIQWRGGGGSPTEPPAPPPPYDEVGRPILTNFDHFWSLKIECIHDPPSRTPSCSAHSAVQFDGPHDIFLNFCEILDHCPSGQKFGGFSAEIYPSPSEGQRSFVIAIASSRAPQSPHPRHKHVTIISIPDPPAVLSGKKKRKYLVPKCQPCPLNLVAVATAAANAITTVGVYWCSCCSPCHRCTSSLFSLPAPQRCLLPFFPLSPGRCAGYSRIGQDHVIQRPVAAPTHNPSSSAIEPHAPATASPSPSRSCASVTLSPTATVSPSASPTAQRRRLEAPESGPPAKSGMRRGEAPRRCHGRKTTQWPLPGPSLQFLPRTVNNVVDRAAPLYHVAPTNSLSMPERLAQCPLGTGSLSTLRGVGGFWHDAMV